MPVSKRPKSIWASTLRIRATRWSGWTGSGRTKRPAMADSHCGRGRVPPGSPAERRPEAWVVFDRTGVSAARTAPARGIGAWAVGCGGSGVEDGHMCEPTGALWDALKEAGVTVHQTGDGWAAHAGPVGVGGYPTLEAAVGALLEALLYYTRQVFADEG